MPWTNFPAQNIPSTIKHCISDTLSIFGKRGGVIGGGIWSGCLDCAVTRMLIQLIPAQGKARSPLIGSDLTPRYCDDITNAQLGHISLSQYNYKSVHSELTTRQLKSTSGFRKNLRHLTSTSLHRVSTNFYSKNLDCQVEKVHLV